MIGSAHVTCENWLKLYDNYLYRTSVFYKGLLLIMSSKLETGGILQTLHYKTYWASDGHVNIGLQLIIMTALPYNQILNTLS